MRGTVMLAAVLVLGACGRGDEAPNAAADATGTNALDLTPEGPGLTARLFGGGRAQPLSIQQPLANGAIIYVTSIQAKATETVIGVRIVNGAERDILLNWSDQKTFLVAAGQKFFVSPPLENHTLKIAQGSTMQGELVFLGTLPRDAQVALVINDGMSDTQYQNTPGISIPLNPTRAAWSDDGSKKNSAA